MTTAMRTASLDITRTAYPGIRHPADPRRIFLPPHDVCALLRLQTRFPSFRVHGFRLAMLAVRRSVERRVAETSDRRVDKSAVLQNPRECLTVPDGSMAVVQRDLRDCEEPRRAVGAKLLDEAAV